MILGSGLNKSRVDEFSFDPSAWLGRLTNRDQSAVSSGIRENESLTQTCSGGGRSGNQRVEGGRRGEKSFAPTKMEEAELPAEVAVGATWCLAALPRGVRSPSTLRSTHSPNSVRPPKR